MRGHNMREQKFEDIVCVAIIFILIAGTVFGIWLTIDGVGIVRLLLM